jgi:hypothetical protein
MRRLILASVCLLGIQVAFAQTKVSNLKKDIVYLSSDALEGRFPGTQGEIKAGDYIAKEFGKLKLKPMGTAGYFQEFPYKYSANPHGTDEKDMISGKGRNVIGFLDNGAEYTVVIGAHYDHLGMGHAGNSLDANPANQIHNGADDNASGTAGMLELARYYTKNKIREPYNFLFIGFSAEEEGLLGSKFFTNNPTLSLEKINYMINMDMIGRLNDSTRKVTVFGTGTSPSIEPAVLRTHGSKLSVKTDSSGMGPSDHSSFYLKNIPVMHFFTGTHMDYHKPSDDADKINYAGVADVLDYIIRVTDELNKEPKQTFTATRNQSSSNGVAFKVTLGVIPDYSYEGEGLRIDGVSEGKPAQKAGLQAGDIILAMDQLEVKNIQDYMKGLAAYKKGEPVVLKVKRGDQVLSLPATF